jgi:hypothetical protein
MGRTAVSPPGAAREDWKIIRYVLLPLLLFASSITCHTFFIVPCLKLLQPLFHMTMFSSCEIGYGRFHLLWSGMILQNPHRLTLRLLD